MSVLKRELVPLKNSNDVVIARQRVRQWAVELRFSLVDQTKLVTAASELGRNALDHGRGGEMTLEVLNEGAKAGLRLIFADNGPGIPAEISKTLFEPFITRQKSNGTGLGLAIVKQYIIAHGGNIKVENNDGALFTIHLPGRS